MDFFFDDKKYHTFKIDEANDGGANPFRKPQYLMINLALGGSWGGKIDDSIFPQKLLMDYVRVYREKGGATGATGATGAAGSGANSSDDAKKIKDAGTLAKRPEDAR